MIKAIFYLLKGDYNHSHGQFSRSDLLPERNASTTRSHCQV